ncbi:MAG TPA: CRISPR-associated protein [Kosmotogaceae bacterium]|nr:CRISPR-associated protein [Kosmotogaceae bacterium]
MINTLVTTVGTSLLRNPRINEPDLLRSLLSCQNPLQDREVGAEINSTASVVDRGYVDDRQNLYLLVSDTEAGRKLGSTLRNYFLQSSRYAFANCQLLVVEGLDDKDPHSFGTKGLRTFIRMLADIFSRHMGSMVINATAGYKAQTAMAVTFGQAFKVPVCYRFEGFEHIITLPPLPMTLDAKLWIANKEFFDLLEGRGTITEKELRSEMIADFRFEHLDPSVKALIDWEKLEGEKLLALSPMGELFVKGARIEFNRLERDITLEDSKIPVNKRFSSNEKEAHSEKFIAAHRSLIDKIVQLPFIEAVTVTGFSAKYDKPVFKATVAQDSIKASLGGKGGTIYMDIRTTARNELEMQKAAEIIETVHH